MWFFVVARSQELPDDYDVSAEKAGIPMNRLDDASTCDSDREQFESVAQSFVEGTQRFQVLAKKVRTIPMHVEKCSA